MRACIGHQFIREQLERLAQLEQMPQGFLFSGPRHVGKRFVADWFARVLIQSNEADEVFQDLLVIEPPQDTSSKRVREKSISIDTIREAHKFLTLSPAHGRRRVLVIDGAEKLGIGSANALLKILEEPPQLSVIILITTEAKQLLPTVISRLVPITFRPVSEIELKKALPEAANFPQFFIDLGLPGVLIEALENPSVFAAKKDILRDLFQLSKLSLRQRLTLAETLAQQDVFLRDVLEIWVVGLMFQVQQKEGRDTKTYSFLHSILKTLQTLSRGEAAPRLTLEKLFFSL